MTVARPPVTPAPPAPPPRSSKIRLVPPWPGPETALILRPVVEPRRRWKRLRRALSALRGLLRRRPRGVTTLGRLGARRRRMLGGYQPTVNTYGATVLRIPRSHAPKASEIVKPAPRSR